MADIYNETKQDEPIYQNPLTGVNVPESVPTSYSPDIRGTNIEVQPNGDVRIGSPTDTANQIVWDQSAQTLSIPTSVPNIANRGWIVTTDFSVTDADTVAWGAGSFISSDGTTYSIGAGNTGNMAAKTYIYLDIGVSTTAYQTTTTASTAVGAGKVLIAIAQNGTGEATFFVLNNDDKNIDAANIVANSITANELSTSITYAGSIVIDTAGNIRSGQTAYDTGTGWFIGNDGVTPKLSIGIGGSTSSSMTWDGTNLTVNGSTLSNNDLFGDGSDGDVTISADTTLTRDMYYNNLTVNSTKNLIGNGYRIFVKGTLTNNGIIHHNGAAGSDGTGVGGAGGAAGYYQGGNTGGNADNNGQNAPNPSLGGAGGNSGGFTGGTVTAPIASLGGFRHFNAAISMRSYSPSPVTNIVIGGGAGGAGGASAGTGGPGGGGGGGGILGVAAKIIVNSSGVISANGGKGGDGTGTIGNGGGGGGGGICIIIYNKLTSGTETANGGAKGNKTGTGTDGVAGSNGLLLKLQV